MIELKLKNNLQQEGYTELREIEGQGLCGLYRFLFTTGLVTGIEAHRYRGRYCYKEHADARNAIVHWDGKNDPSGPWIKYKGKGGERSRIEDKYEDS